MTPHMFFVYILTGIREWREGMSSQLEAGRIEREALKLEYEKRRIAERQAALHAREEQLRSRTPNVTPNPSRRRADIDRNIYAEEAVVSGADVYNNEENVAASAVEVESSAPATAEPAVIDPSIVDDIMRRENEKLNRRSEPVDIDELADSNAAIPVESDSNVVESDAPPFAHESDGGDSADESETDSEKPVKLSFFRREKVKPLEKTASQKLDELETDEIDLSKIFVDPETAENPVVSNTSELAEAGEPPFDTSAEIDLIIEKSRVEASAKAGEPIGLPDEDDEPENSEPPFDVDDTAAAEPEPQPVSTPIVEQVKPQPTAEYRFPPIPLLNYDPSPQNADMSGEIQQTAVKLVETLRSFNVKTKIINVSRGPTITRYELQPEIGTKVRSILNLVDDIALHLATSGVRIEAPIPGKEAVGIEVPNKTTSMVYIRELIEDAGFKNAQSKVATCLGMDVAGNPVFLDIAKMPHILIAGTTGSGKSVCINSLIISILYKARPDEVKFILIDPKKVELNIYNGLPHLIVPVVSDPKKAAGSLHWAVTEMERRYELIEGAGVRNLKGYNQSIANDPTAERLPQIVIIIDELADLMMTAKDDVEESICRIAQKARAAGMHLVIGTQRPSVDVITGLIKANVPSRIAFTTVSQVDSRTIIDVTGAEKLIGRGDMLFSPVGSIKPIRVQGSFVSDEEVDAVTTFIKQNSGKQDYDQSVMESIEREAQLCGNKKATVLGDGDEEANDGDPMLKPAIQLAVESGKISTSLIQRRLQLGYGRAAKLIDMMEQMGIVGPPQGQKPREVLISKQDYMEMELRKE
ncbi:MAG: DNA translocase FtsK [Clostridiales bacterium]|nr:DNA translocase FtsK [Clostridiales bacterium]